MNFTPWAALPIQTITADPRKYSLLHVEISTSRSRRETFCIRDWSLWSLLELCSYCLDIWATLNLWEISLRVYIYLILTDGSVIALRTTHGSVCSNADSNKWMQKAVSGIRTMFISIPLNPITICSQERA